ncbi:hypothetical protein BDY17DRAFT_256528 [Neohortaea acidophila]|uniref:MutL C-terminal dimerisation domain-containing protein n=1 Tax=Neohortaea acidophila TaxID=245834 RepID=A0A6A6PJJ0_9PEZI|nr:uncharacterized protein BDY17DRAFT_256528 [Neohortaea acidophila]KAF2480095.1 hypothetical protein BDY17DRAFT_256528 [Neohortaea acidophila]
MPRILPLAHDTISQIQSSRQITSLEGVVLALVENSLDAGSTKLTITVDFRRGACIVDDNGSGIRSDEFAEDGGLGRMHHTSKHSSESDGRLHGSSGTYLASLAALSFLSISSRHLDTQQHANITFHQGRVIKRQASVTSDADIPSSGRHGTRVEVRNLFGNMPVRVKQRTLAAQDGKEDDKAWAVLKHGIVALLLAWKEPCSVTISPESSPARTLRLSALHPAVTAALTEKSLHTLRGATVKYELKDALPLLFQAGLAPHDTRDRWVPVSASTRQVSIRGLICLDAAPTRHCQFISLGVRPCSELFSNSDVSRTVNTIFEHSNFGAMEDDLDVEQLEKHRRKGKELQKGNGLTQRHLRGRKPIDRWPMFVLKIEVASGTHQHLESQKLVDSRAKAIDEVMETMITQWLVAHHFRPRKQRQSGHKRKYVDALGNAHDVGQHDLLRPATSSDHFSSWSRIKSGRPAFYDEMWLSRKPATAPAEQMGTRGDEIETPNKSAFELPVLEAGSLNHSGQPPETGAGHSPADNPEGGDVLVDWQDPISKQTFKVNSRTGVALLPANPIRAAAGVRQPAAVQRAASLRGLPLLPARRSEGASLPGWLPTFLEEWRNPVFAPQQEEKIPTASLTPLGEDSVDVAVGQRTHASTPAALTKISATILSKLSKGALKQATVIQQVDRKYILCKMRSNDIADHVEALVLVDQHAASERATLEGLLAELCEPGDIRENSRKVKTMSLEKTLRFEVSEVEWHHFRAHKQRFVDWGIVYELTAKAEDLSASQVGAPRRCYMIRVQSLPPGIAERCISLPKLLIDLLRSEIWSIVDSGSSPETSLDVAADAHADGTHGWLSRIGSCPKGIIELLNSRACRSAIMFNDELSLDQCKALMMELGDCAFPFMCAHGRVSMVPVAEIRCDFEDSEGDVPSWEKPDVTGSFVEAFRNWSNSSSDLRTASTD